MNSSLIDVFLSVINNKNNSKEITNENLNIQFNLPLINLSTSLNNESFMSFSVYPTNNEILEDNEYICIEKYDYYESTEKWLLGIKL